jgi:hypothetical protein
MFNLLNVFTRNFELWSRASLQEGRQFVSDNAPQVPQECVMPSPARSRPVSGDVKAAMSGVERHTCRHSHILPIALALDMYGVRIP